MGGNATFNGYSGVTTSASLGFQKQQQFCYILWYSLVEWEAEHMKRRFLAFLVCMAVLLASFTGCYSAQDGPSTLSSSQTMQSNSGSAAENSVGKCSGGYQICSVSHNRRLLDVDIVHTELYSGLRPGDKINLYSVLSDRLRAQRCILLGLFW